MGLCNVMSQCIARAFRLASNRFIVREIANIKVCQYQVMISNGLFEETNENVFFLNNFTVNLFHATGFFLYPLKTSENQRFSDVFRG